MSICPDLISDLRQNNCRKKNHIMTKILVLSDSHRNMENMHRAVLKEAPDLILHLGDHYQDAKQLHAEFPEIPLAAVRGNCDYGQTHQERLIDVDGIRIFLCHGHRHHVKSSLLVLEYAAREQDAKVALYGHTHVSFLDESGDLVIMNPGSIGEPRDYGGPAYGLLFLEDGQVFARLMRL